MSMKRVVTLIVDNTMNNYQPLSIDALKLTSSFSSSFIKNNPQPNSSSNAKNFEIFSGIDYLNDLSLLKELFINSSLSTRKSIQYFLSYQKKFQSICHILFPITEFNISNNLQYELLLLDYLAENKINNIAIHLIIYPMLNPDHLISSLNNLNNKLTSFKLGKIYSLCGFNRIINPTDFIQSYNKSILQSVPDLIQALNIFNANNFNLANLPTISLKDYHLSYNNNSFIFFNTINSNLPISLLSSFNLSNYANPYYISLFQLKELNGYIIKPQSVKYSLLTYLADLGLSTTLISSSTFYDINRMIIKDNKKLNTIISHNSQNQLNYLYNATINSINNDDDFILTVLPFSDTENKTTMSSIINRLTKSTNENFYSLVILILNNYPHSDYFLINDSKISLSNGNHSMIMPTILHYLDISLPKEIKNSKSLY